MTLPTRVSDTPNGGHSRQQTQRRRIGAVVSLIESFGRDALAGLFRYAHQIAGWDLELQWPGVDARLRNLKEWDGDGVILQIAQADQVEDVLARGLPAVQISSRAPHPQLPAVLADDVAIGRLAAEHLMNCGFRNFAYWGIPGHRFSQLRVEGFCEGLTAHQLECLGELECNSPEERGVSRKFEERLLALPRPIGVFAVSDTRARALLHAVRNVGLRVPEDIAILGVDNDPLEQMAMDMAISSIDPGFDRIGYEAAKCLDQWLATGHPGPLEPRLIAPRGLIVRQSTELLAIKDPVVAEALRLIRENIKNQISVKEVVNGVGLSRRAFEVRFKRVVGRTPLEEIRRTRIEKARAILTTTDLPMDEVARQSGLTNAKVMSMIFRRETGVTPSAYRTASRKFT